MENIINGQILKCPMVFEKNLHFLFKGYKDMYVYVSFCIFSYLCYSKVLFLLIFIQSVIDWQLCDVSELIIVSAYILVFDDYVIYHQVICLLYHHCTGFLSSAQNIIFFSQVIAFCLENCCSYYFWQDFLIHHFSIFKSSWNFICLCISEYI